MTDTNKKKDDKESPKLNCGLVIPISATADCSEQHWLDVRAILTEAIESAGFRANLVSDADDVGIIQKRIIQNLYENPIVVCDVSGKNPNVMFELGLRLAFDKPTIIVKDDATSYSFDTASIEHLDYPRDLRFNKIMTFKNNLSDKIMGTHKKATEDKSYTTFLKHFGKFSVAQLESTEVSRDDYLIAELDELKRMVSRILRRDRDITRRLRSYDGSSFSVEVLDDMRKAYHSALSHFSNERDRVTMPELETDVANYIMEHTNLGRHFKGRDEFIECLYAATHEREPDKNVY